MLMSPTQVSLPLQIGSSASGLVSGLFLRPPDAASCVVLAHGAGAGMTHPFMEAVAGGLAQRGIATLRYQFPFMEQGARAPDRPAVAHATVRAAVDAAAGLAPDLKLVAGGKSFGGRMTSQAQAAAPIPGVRGLVFIGFPLHPAGKPSADRGEHLVQVRVPTLFLQGTRDALADMGLLGPLLARLGGIASLTTLEEADHGFHVRARSGRTDTGVMVEMLDSLEAWIEHL